MHSTVEKTLKMFVKPRLCLKLCFLRLFDLCLCSWQPFPNLFSEIAGGGDGGGGRVGWLLS